MNESSNDKTITNIASYVILRTARRDYIRKSEIIRDVLKEKLKPSNYLDLVESANLILKRDFGLELYDLDKEDKFSKDHRYIVLNRLSEKPRVSKETLTRCLICAIVHVFGNRISGDELMKNVRDLLNDYSIKDLQSLIFTDMIQEGYLKSVTENSSESNSVVWLTNSLKAEKEFDLAKFINKVIDKAKS